MREQLRRIVTEKGPLPLIIFIFLMTLVVYFDALFNEFVYDDIPQVLTNPWIRNIGYIPEIFSSDVWHFEIGASFAANYYRPLMHLIYMLNYHLFGLNSWGFHLMNILIHAGNSILVFLITARIIRGSSTLSSPYYLLSSFVAALFFVTHPIHTEAVSWVSGLPELSFTFFYLLSFFLYVRHDSVFMSGYLPSLTSFFLATLCKETALTLPAVLVVYDYTFRKIESDLPSLLKRYGPFCGVIGIYLVLRINALGGFLPVQRHGELTLYQYVINIFPLFFQYLEKLVMPINLNFFHVFHPVTSLVGPEALLSLFVTAAFVVLTCATFRRSKITSFGLFFLAFTLLPALYIPGVGENTLAERYLYLPSFGFVLLIGLFVAWAMRSQRYRTTLTVAFLSLIGLSIVGTVLRNAVWKDSYTLWTDTVRKSPDSAGARLNLGDALLGKGAIDEAIRQYLYSLSLRPTEIANNNLGYVYSVKGYRDKAIQQYKQAIRLNYNYAKAHYNLANSYSEIGRIDEAIGEYLITIRLNPNLPEAHNNLGIAYASRGQINEAVKQFEMAVKLSPERDDFRSNLVAAYGSRSIAR
jgi:Tfp pilus assembly protein PilF